MLLPFRIVIPPEQQDAELSQKLLIERPGIFNSAIKGLRRLRTQKRFTEPAICRVALEDYRDEANPARAFLHEYVYECPRTRLVCGLLYQQYRESCEADGYDALNEKDFGKEVARAFPTVRRVRGTVLPDGRRPWFYEGIALGSAENRAPLMVPKARARKS
jgi:putative DNA primase/helicase